MMMSKNFKCTPDVSHFGNIPFLLTVVLEARTFCDTYICSTK